MQESPNTLYCYLSICNEYTFLWATSTQYLKMRENLQTFAFQYFAVPMENTIGYRKCCFEKYLFLSINYMYCKMVVF